MQRSADSNGGRDSNGDHQIPPAILLIEDEPGIVDFVTRGLQAEGFAVEPTWTGSRASGARCRRASI